MQSHGSPNVQLTGGHSWSRIISPWKSLSLLLTFYYTWVCVYFFYTLYYYCKTILCHLCNVPDHCDVKTAKSDAFLGWLGSALEIRWGFSFTLGDSWGDLGFSPGCLLDSFLWRVSRSAQLVGGHEGRPRTRKRAIWPLSFTGWFIYLIFQFHCEKKRGKWGYVVIKPLSQYMQKFREDEWVNKNNEWTFFHLPNDTQLLLFFLFFFHHEVSLTSNACLLLCSHDDEEVLFASCLKMKRPCTVS